ncbi:MAG TPA: DUF2505 family protein [Polyangiaceae bacterium]|nr:DUF2505 family protein [Polyangiaceae bacterium]
MRIEIRQHFAGATLDDVERLYMLDETFNRETFAALGYERRVLVADRHAERLLRTLHLCPTRALPAPFSSLLRGGTFHIEEQVAYDFAAHRGTWTTAPSLLANQFQASGTFSFAGDHDGVTFHLEGSARSTLPLLARSAEKQGVRTAEQQHAGLAAAVRARIARGASRAASLDLRS